MLKNTVSVKIREAAVKTAVKAIVSCTFGHRNENEQIIYTHHTMYQKKIKF